MKIIHFSDSHTLHRKLKLPEADILIFSGDCSNPRDTLINSMEVMDFMQWFSVQKGTKIFVAGNHDVSIERGAILKEDFERRGIIYLENDWVNTHGLKIYGSPLTPSFGQGWAWNKARHKIGEYWEHIPDDIDVLVTHGPPKGYLDYTLDHNRRIVHCGCASLITRIEQIKPKLHCFGHIHNGGGIINAGVFRDSRTGILYSNGAVVEEGNYEAPITNGNLIEL
jgi:Icc-related predicted phosphoesterase